MLAMIGSLSIAMTAHAQPMPACRTDIPLVLQPSTCPHDPQAEKLVQQAAAASSLASQRPAKKTLADLLRERDGNDPRPHAATERRPDGANLIKGRTLVR